MQLLSIFFVCKYMLAYSVSYIFCFVLFLWAQCLVYWTLSQEYNVENWKELDDTKQSNYRISISINGNELLAWLLFQNYFFFAFSAYFIRWTYRKQKYLACLFIKRVCNAKWFRFMYVLLRMFLMLRNWFKFCLCQI